MNKKWIIILAVIAMIFLPYLSEMNAQCGGGGNGGNGNGNGSGNGNQNGHGNGNGNGNGNGSGIINGTAFTFSGTVTDVGVVGNGLVIDGSLTVTGLGPFSYWESYNIGRPVVGDAVSGNGYTVDYNGIEHNVLTNITVNGKTIEMRDADGYPLWRGNGGGYGNGGNEWCGGGYGSYENILEGTPFVIEGDVISLSSMGNSGFNGNGLVIASVSGNETVNGLGPCYYWDNLGVVRPVVGDRVKTEGFAMLYNLTSVNVLMSITLSDGVKVQLRDPDTGAPLWRR